MKEVNAVGFFTLFRFADGFDKLLMAVGTIAAAANGAALPAFSLLWGNMTDAFGDSASNPNLMVDTARGVMWNFLEIGIGVFVASWLMFACWMVAGERQAIRCRKVYLRTLLNQ
jgi:ATP-binding cassette subfamily B (MDR/TAP) protein 1